MHRFKPDKVPLLRGGGSHRLPSLTKSYLQLTPSGRREISCLHWSLTEYINHTSGQALCPGVADQHKTYFRGLSVFLCFAGTFLVFCLFVLIFVFVVLLFCFV